MSARTRDPPVPQRPRVDVFPYWLLYSMYAGGALAASPQRQNRTSILFTLACIAATFFIGLRFETGGDWFNYIVILRYTPESLPDATAVGDPAYMFLNWLANELGVGLWLVNLCCATIFMTGLGRFVRREPNPWLAMVVAVPYLIVVVAMGYTRQAVAIGLMMWGIGYLLEGRYVPALLSAALAFLFHKSSIVLLPIVALASVRHRLVIWTLLALAVFTVFSFFLDSALAKLNSNYLQAEMSSDGAGIRVAMDVVPALIFLPFQRRLCPNPEERNLWRNFSIASLASLVALFVLPSTTVVDRLALYLIPLQIVVLGRLPSVFQHRGRSNLQLSLGVIVYSAAVMAVWLSSAVHAAAWIPYRFLLFEE